MARRKTYQRMSYRELQERIDYGTAIGDSRIVRKAIYEMNKRAAETRARLDSFRSTTPVTKTEVRKILEKIKQGRSLSEREEWKLKKLFGNR